MTEFLESALAANIAIGIAIFFVSCVVIAALAFMFDCEHNENYYDDEEEWAWYCINVRNKRALVTVDAKERTAWEKEGF